jgi:TolB-like protein/Tfp pilus assembly protein PilF
MLIDRWQTIERLYHTASERRPEERRSYLESACGGDEEVLREVESLLANEELAERFLETSPQLAGEQAADLTVPAGAQIAPYVVLEFLQAGGMGEVYKARDPRLNRPVAIKFLPRAFTADPTALQRFQREARAASALNHPRICTIHDLGDYEGRPFFVMEFLEGQSLKDRIAEKPVPVPELVDLGIQICDALQAAHAKGIVHRDIKPANIMIAANGQIKVLDFGLAKLAAEPRRSPSPTAPLAEADETVTGITLTRPGSLMGTLAYLSPEQARGEEVDARTDIFSLGVVLYQMATGRPTFGGKTSGELIGAILHQTPVKPSALNPAIPAGLERIVLKALEKDRASRYQSASELLAELEQFQESAAAAGRTRRWLLASSGAAIAALAGGVFLPRLAIFSPKKKTMVAVLPLENLGGDPKQAYFAAGLHNEMISILGRLYPDGLGVIAQTSMSRYQGTKKPISQIGSELRADYVVRGGVRRDAGRFHISAQLIRVADQKQLWGENYDRDLRQALAVQVEVAQAVAQGIERSLRPNPQVAMALARPLDPQAYEAYLRGDFQKSIELDPYYAPAYTALANKIYLGALFGYLSPLPTFNNMMAAASKAVELEPTLADAHAALALGKLHAQWKWHEAEADFRSAVKLDPGNAGVRHYFAHFLLWANRGKESAEECNHALEHDPYDPELMACVGWHDLWSGDYDHAIASARRSLSFDPNGGFASLIVGWSYEQKGMFPEAISALQKSFPGTVRTASVAHALASSGKRKAAEDLLGQLLEASEKSYVSAYDVAAIYLGLGEKDRALDWLRKAYDEHSGFMVYVHLDPRLKSLRTEARFQDLLGGMGFGNQRA